MNGHDLRICCPALVVRGDLPLASAQTMLLEKISAATSSRAHRLNAATRGMLTPTEVVSCPCVFPGDAAAAAPRHVLLSKGSRGALLPAAKLDSLLARALPQLTDEHLRFLADHLSERA